MAQEQTNYTVSDQTAQYMSLCAQYLDITEKLSNCLYQDKRLTGNEAEDLFDEAVNEGFFKVLERVLGKSIVDRLLQGETSV